MKLLSFEKFELLEVNNWRLLIARHWIDCSRFNGYNFKNVNYIKYNKNDIGFTLIVFDE